MMRISIVFLCLILFAAAAGRYRAETAMRDAIAEIDALQTRQAQQHRQTQVLRTEVALLESPERLAELADAHTDLAPLTGAQLMSADEFLIAFGRGASQEETDEATPVAPFRPATLADAGAVGDRGGR